MRLSLCVCFNKDMICIQHCTVHYSLCESKRLSNWIVCWWWEFEIDKKWSAKTMKCWLVCPLEHCEYNVAVDCFLWFFFFTLFSLCVLFVWRTMFVLLFAHHWTRPVQLEWEKIVCRRKNVIKISLHIHRLLQMDANIVAEFAQHSFGCQHF